MLCGTSFYHNTMWWNEESNTVAWLVRGSQAKTHFRMVFKTEGTWNLGFSAQLRA